MTSAYFTASTSFDGELIHLYKAVLAQLKANKIHLTSGAQIADEKLLEKDKKKSKEEIFKRERKNVEAADCIIAEVSKPSLGVGGEIVYGLTEKKPVLALVREGFEEKLSPMLTGNPSENLFVEYYNDDNLPLVIKNFLHHIQSLKEKKGKLIVIDGGDGSGKQTQVTLLEEYLIKSHKKVKVVDFPRYYTSFHGRTVAKFLRGEFGALDQISPYLASLAYALDRASMKEELEMFLKKGGYVLANRYATSTLGHQAARISDETERNKFIKWAYQLEYNVHRIPKEDVVVFLYVPWKIGMELTKKKTVRAYLQGKEDIQEKDIEHRMNAEKMYLELCKRYRHWIRIDCTQNGKLLSREVIHNKVLRELQKRKFI